MQLFTLFSYVMDGFAYAGEALSGRYIGARNRKAFTDTVRHLFIWGAGLTVLFTLVYASGGNAFLALLTDDRNVITAADTYFYWALAIPAAGIAAFIWDGIFIGATATRGMLLSMAASAVSFFAVYYGFHTVLGNHALWLAFLVYLSMRGAMQTLLSRKVMEKKLSLKAFHDEVAINPINIYSQTNESKNKPYLLSLPEKERNARYYTQSRKYTAHQEHGLQPLHHGGEKPA